jgi:hypothetical protein
MFMTAQRSTTPNAESNGPITSVRRTEESAKRARDDKQRTQGFEERYAVEHEQHADGERAKPADSSWRRVTAPAVERVIRRRGRHARLPRRQERPLL